MKHNLKFLLADDHAIVRKGLKQILKEEFATLQITEVSNAEAALSAHDTYEFDLTICDISMPGITGLELCRKIKKKKPEQLILILSMHNEEQYAIRAFKAGASGYLAKESAPEELIKAVRFILTGKRYVSASLASLMINHLSAQSQLEPHQLLSDRELEVIKFIAQGKSLTAIGETLHLSPNTISTYRSRILDKMKMRSNAELIRYMHEHNLK